MKAHGQRERLGLPRFGENRFVTIGSVVIVGERLIDADTQTVCQVPIIAGEISRFSVRVDDMGTGLTFAWTATGASIVSGATSQQVEVQLPAQAGASVTLGVTVKRPDGGMSSGSYTFQTITSMAAALEQVICEISHIITQPPFQTNPGDPGPGGRVVNPGDIASLAAAAERLSQTASAVSKAAAPLEPVAGRTGLSGAATRSGDFGRPIVGSTNDSCVG